MRLFTSKLAVPTSPGAGSPQNCRDYRDKWAQIGGTFVGNLSLEVSLDGQEFIAVQTGITAAALYEIKPSAQSIRVVVNTLASGTPVVILNGYYLE